MRRLFIRAGTPCAYRHLAYYHCQIRHKTIQKKTGTHTVRYMQPEDSEPSERHRDSYDNDAGDTQHSATASSNPVRVVQAHRLLKKNGVSGSIGPVRATIRAHENNPQP